MDNGQLEDAVPEVRNDTPEPPDMRSGPPE